MKIANNEVLNQFRQLHAVSIELKEKFDKEASLEVLNVLQDQYGRELQRLAKLVPSEVLSKGYLLRHSTFLNKYLVSGQPQNCYQDINAICLTDIFEAEENYLHYLSETDIEIQQELNWNIIHPRIFELAKPRFEKKLYSDAIEASFKEINKIIKMEYKNLSGLELDGEKLMRKVFSSSPNNQHNPVFKLADNTNESGRNFQDGYMNVFAGVMRGIRNPHAHDNLTKNQVEAWELIILASHLMRVWDDSIDSI